MKSVKHLKPTLVILLSMIMAYGLLILVYKWNTEKIEVEKTVFSVTAGVNHQVITRVDTGGQKLVALTIDDGPDPRFTPAILDILKEYHIKATFFVVGENCEAHPDLVKRELREGHEIENHTYSHPDLVDDNAINTEEEIERDQEIIEKLTKQRPIYFRPPKRLFKNETIDIADLNGYTTVLWTIGLEHKKAKTIEDMANRLVDAAKPGNILLAHDGRLDRTRTVEALPLVIKGYQSKGYKFVTLKELLKHQSQ